MAPRQRRKKLAPKPTKGERKAARANRNPGGLGAALVAFAAVVTAGIAAAVGLERADKKKCAELRERLVSKPLVKSDHAVCRMDCRFVSDADVDGVLGKGRINYKKSDLNASPCPRVALVDGRVTAVFADCRSDTRLVTVIDTETDWPCGPC